jgi:hypothetical protein
MPWTPSLDPKAVALADFEAAVDELHAKYCACEEHVYTSHMHALFRSCGGPCFAAFERCDDLSTCAL